MGWGVVRAGLFLEKETQAHQKQMRQERLKHMMMPTLLATESCKFMKILAECEDLCFREPSLPGGTLFF
jgi:hypothetical protein